MQIQAFTQFLVMNGYFIIDGNPTKDIIDDTIRYVSKINGTVNIEMYNGTGWDVLDNVKMNELFDNVLV